MQFHPRRIYRRLASATVVMPEHCRIDIPELRLPTRTDNIEKLAELAIAHGAGLARLLPGEWNKSPASVKMLLASAAIAHNLKPYGPGSAADLPSMLSATALDCSNYGLLTFHIATHAVRLARLSLPPIAFVGWEGGDVGNHQTMFVAGGGGGTELMLDPTFGVAAMASFDIVASGRPLASSQMIAINAKNEVRGARARMLSALARGAFKPSELLYYFESADQLINRFGHPTEWPTPGAAHWRRNRA